MAWHLEKTTTGIDIVIDGFDKGIAPDPTSGMQDMRQVNLLTQPHTVMVGFPITQSTTSGGTLGKPISKATAFTGYGIGAGGATGSIGAQQYFILDDSGQVWNSSSLTGTWTFLSTSNSTTGSSATDGIWFWKGFLFKTRGANVDYYDGSTWHTAWKTDLAAVLHVAITPIDDAVYITNGAYVASLKELVYGTFDPASSGTYNWNTTAFQLPGNDSAISLAQLGIGTTGSTITLLVGGTQNVIYPFSTTALSFNTPIFIGDNYIKRMVTVNQSVFIFPGNVQGRGRIWVTNGTRADQVYKIPDSITGKDEPYYRWGDAIFHRNSLVFSFEADTNSNSAISGIADVWALDLDTQAFRSITTLTAPSGSANALVLIPDQSNNAAAGSAYIAGWTDLGSNHYIGNSSTSAGTGTAVIKTDQIPVGNFFNKYSWSQVEVQLQTPLASGESAVVAGFSDNASAGSTTTINATGAISGFGSASFAESQWLQFQLSLTGNSESSGCRVRRIIVHGTMIPVQRIP